MQVKKTLAPGQKGTKKLLEQYGEKLVCVRYRYDKVRQKRLKTVELIVDEQDWISGVSIPVVRQVALKIKYGEKGLQEKIKSEGGYWHPEKKAWILPFHKVSRLGLENRVVSKSSG